MVGVDYIIQLSPKVSIFPIFSYCDNHGGGRVSPCALVSGTDMKTEGCNYKVDVIVLRNSATHSFQEITLKFNEVFKKVRLFFAS